MCMRPILLAAAIGLCLANTHRAKAEVIYTVFNPVAAPFPFVLFVYDSPTFITTNTTVDVGQLAFANPANTITDVEFKPSSSGVSELDVFQSGGGADQTFNGNQFRYYPLGAFDEYGVTAGINNAAGDPSFGAPNSMLSVEAPEPSTFALLLGGLVGLVGLRRRASDES
jgi:hypothetical protein